MFLVPVTEEEALKVTSKLMGKFCMGYDEIPENTVKQCIQFIKEPPNFIFNLSLGVPSGNLFMNEVPVIKSLDLQIDKNLDWKSHVEHILPKLSSAAFLIRSLPHFISKKFYKWCIIFSFSLYS
jgi:hypothetical protein